MSNKWGGSIRGIGMHCRYRSPGTVNLGGQKESQNFSFYLVVIVTNF